MVAIIGDKVFHWGIVGSTSGRGCICSLLPLFSLLVLGLVPLLSHVLRIVIPLILAISAMVFVVVVTFPRTLY
jgi:hypothetical protein